MRAGPNDEDTSFYSVPKALTTHGVLNRAIYRTVSLRTQKLRSFGTQTRFV